MLKHLPRLVSPFNPSTVNDFVGNHKPFLSQRDQPDYFSDLLSVDDLLAFFSRNDIAAHNLQLVHNGQYIPASEYTYGAQASGRDISVVDTRKAFDFFNAGATIFLGGLEYSIESLRNFYQGIVSELNCPAGLTGFFTPSNSQGFSAHFDDVDVFVLQLFGSKKWRVYNCAVPFAVVTADCTAFPENLSIEVELKPGDTLYVPRGYIHEASATDQASFHVSLSFSQFNWIDIFKMVCFSAAQLEGFRTPVPDGVSPDECRSILVKHFSDLVFSTNFPFIFSNLEQKVANHLAITNNDYIDSVRQQLVW